MDDWALRALLLSATSAIAVAQPGARWLLVPALLACFIRTTRLPQAARHGLPLFTWSLVAVAFPFGIAWTIYPVFPPTVERLAPSLFGIGFALLACALHTCRAAWPSHRALHAALLGCFAVAGLDPLARLAGPIAVGCVALLVLARPERRALGGAAGVLLLSAGMAAGTVRLLPWAQPLVEAAAAGSLSSGTAGLSLGPTSRLGELESVALSSSVVLRVWARAPQKLRARVLDRFDGVTWSATGTALPQPLQPVSEESIGTGAWRDFNAVPGTTYLVSGDAASALAPHVSQDGRVLLAQAIDVFLSPAETVLLRVSTTRPVKTAGEILHLPQGEVASLYGFVSASALRPGLEPGPELSAVPATTDPRLVALAARLADGAEPQARVNRTLEHLGRECRYALNVGAFRTRQPVAEFLFDKKRGYCEYFASAAAVLLRLEGVPTRYVTGLNVTPANFEAGHYVVRESDAHAWIEAWIPGRGWVEFDPTPAGQYDELHAASRSGAFGVAWEWLCGTAAALWARAVHGGLPHPPLVPSAVFGILAALVVLARSLRRRRPRRVATIDSGPPPDLARLLARLDAVWRRHGHPRPASRGPLEHADALAASTLPRPLVSLGREIALHYYEARFGGRPLAAGQAQELARRLVTGA